MQGSKSVPIQGKTKRPAVSNQVKLDSVEPIPFKNGNNVFSFVNQVAYLPFLSPKDRFAQDLLEARLLSLTGNACITKKAEWCRGVGFHDTKGKDLPKEFTDWLKSMNLKNENVTAINESILADVFTYGNVPVEIVRMSVAGKKKLFVYVHNFQEWRLCKPDEDDIVREAVQSKLFLRDNGYVTADMLKQGKRLPIYSPLNTERQNWYRDKNGVERTLIWYHNKVTGFPYYGMPSNIAAMIYHILEYKGARFNLDGFDNNMVVAALLALKGNLGQDEANRIAKQIVNSHTGDGKRGRTLVIASEQGIEGSDYHQMSNKTDGSYNESDDKWSQKIFLANDWDPILAGFVNPSTLGKGSGYITKLIEHKLNTTIKPAQKHLFEQVWIHILKIASDWLGFKLESFDIEIKNAIDISGLTDVDITPAVQINEVRKAKGLPEDPSQDGVYMKAAAGNNNPQNQGGTNVPA